MDIVAEIQRLGGAASRGQLEQIVSGSRIDHQVRRGHVVRPFPRTYCLAVRADEPNIRERAALLHLGNTAALSDVTALRRWQLPVPSIETVHAIVPNAHSHRPARGLRVHRTYSLPPAIVLRGLATVTAAAAVVGAWPELAGAAQRAPALAAVRTKLATVQELRTEVERNIRLKGRARLIDLIALLEAGCESELELWGYTDVFNVDGLGHGVRQRRFVVADGRCFRADLTYEDERLIVELDGRAFHAGPRQWERDIARDAALATLGWQTLRFSHARLTKDVGAVRREVLATLAARRSH